MKKFIFKFLLVFVFIWIIASIVWFFGARVLIARRISHNLSPVTTQIKTDLTKLAAANPEYSSYDLRDVFLPAVEDLNLSAYSFESESGSVNYYRVVTANGFFLRAFSINENIRQVGTLRLIPSSRLLTRIIISKDIIAALAVTAFALLFISIVISAMYAYKTLMKPAKDFEKATASILINKTRELSLLKEISSAIAIAPDLKKTFEKITEVARDAFSADFCAVFSHDKLNNMLVIREGAVTAKDVDKESLNVSDTSENSIVAKTFRSQEPCLSRDIAGKSGEFSADAEKLGLKSMIVVPLVCEAETIGVLAVGRYVADAYTEEDKNFAVIIASRAAVLIKNADLYDELASCRLVI